MVAARDNPFRVQRLERLRFRDWQGEDSRAVIDTLLDHRRGAIVGPHGTGKTTLLDAIAERAADRGQRVLRVQLRRERGAVKGEIEALWRHPPDRDTMVLLDSAGCLSWLDRLRVSRACREARSLLVTSHRDTFVETVYRTHIGAQLLRRLLADLDVPSRYDARALELLAQLDGNLRETFRALYDVAAAEGEGPG